MKILVVEDDRLQRDLLRNWLSARGHEVMGAADGEGAREELASRRYDVVVLDWLMPGMSGQDVLRWLRARGDAPAVVFATACGDEFEVASILELGADDYVVKPLRRLELVARVEAAGRRRGAAATIVNMHK